MPRLRDLTGQCFGQLTAIRREGTHPATRKPMWRCRCSCGAETLVVATALSSGHTSSCGCSRTRPRTHGKTRTRVWRAWVNMRARCQRQSHPRYGDWGGRGICVHPRWESFENFYMDMGDPPDGHTLDRINNDGNYEPGNCRWTTPAEQNRNKRRLTAA
jgi:hypothetical protein